jgi:hypothetical protein
VESSLLDLAAPFSAFGGEVHMSDEERALRK